MNRILLWLAVTVSLSLSPTRLWAMNLDASVFHYEYYETITHDQTKIRYNTDSPDPSDPDHEIQTEIFAETLAGLTGVACDSTNNNNCIFGSDNAASYTYTHFLINPNLSPGNEALIVPLTDDSLIEFSLKLKIKNSGTGELFDVTASPLLAGTPVTLASGVTVSDISGKEIEFNLYEDSANPSALANLADLNIILASISNPNGSLQINITGSGATNGGGNNFKLASSDLELEYTPASVPEPASLLLLGAGLLAVGAWGWRRRP